MPCNFNHRELAEKVKEGIRAAGGTPMEFNLIKVERSLEGIKAGIEKIYGRRFIEPDYSWDKIAEKQKNIWQQLAKEIAEES